MLQKYSILGQLHSKIQPYGYGLYIFRPTPKIILWIPKNYKYAKYQHKCGNFQEHWNNLGRIKHFSTKNSLFQNIFLGCNKGYVLQFWEFSRSTSLYYLFITFSIMHRFSWCMYQLLGYKLFYLHTCMIFILFKSKYEWFTFEIKGFWSETA